MEAVKGPAPLQVLMFKCPFPHSLEVCIKPEGVVCGPRHNTHTLVLSYPLLKEVCLSLQRNVLHEVKWVLYPIDLKIKKIQNCQPASN